MRGGQARKALRAALAAAAAAAAAHLVSRSSHDLVAGKGREKLALRQPVQRDEGPPLAGRIDQHELRPVRRGRAVQHVVVVGDRRRERTVVDWLVLLPPRRHDRLLLLQRQWCVPLAPGWPRLCTSCRRTPCGDYGGAPPASPSAVARPILFQVVAGRGRAKARRCFLSAAAIAPRRAGRPRRPSAAALPSLAAAVREYRAMPTGNT